MKVKNATIGAVVMVKEKSNTLFYSGNVGKIGIIKHTRESSDDFAKVLFQDGISDYGTVDDLKYLGRNEDVDEFLSREETYYTQNNTEDYTSNLEKYLLANIDVLSTITGTKGDK